MAGQTGPEQVESRVGRRESRVGGAFVRLRRSQYLLHSSDPVPGSDESLEHVPWRGRRAPRLSEPLQASQRQAHLPS